MIKRYLVIGNPIEHSLSPKLHNYWLKKNNIEANYDKKKINENELKNIASTGTINISKWTSNLNQIIQKNPGHIEYFLNFISVIILEVK